MNDQSHLWKPGQSGNPTGRKPGSGEIGKLRAAIAEHVPEIIAKLVEQAKHGDAGSARLLLERVLPPLKASKAPALLILPDGSLTDQGRAVMRSIADGELSPLQGSALLGSLGTLAKIVETDDLMKRIEALELRSKGGKQ